MNSKTLSKILLFCNNKSLKEKNNYNYTYVTLEQFIDIFCDPHGTYVFVAYHSLLYLHNLVIIVCW